MAKKNEPSKAIEKVKPALPTVQGVELPEWLAQEEVVGVEDLSKHIVPARIKVVQKQSKQELLDLFMPGDVIAVPLMAVIAEGERDAKGRPVEGGEARFNIIPVFFYAEYCTWNDREKCPNDPAILYRTLDPKDPVAIKARNQRTRIENHPSVADAKVEHAEHLNFVVVLDDHPLGMDQQFILSFMRGSHQQGTNFAARIKARKAPIFGCRFEAKVMLKKNMKGEWFVLDCDNPSDERPWVDKDTYEALKMVHEQYQQYYNDNLIRVNYEDEVPDETDAVGDFG